MGLDLYNSRMNSCRSIEVFELNQVNIRQADCTTLTFVYQTFHGTPGFEQCHAIVVHDLAFFISRILLVTRSKRETCMHQVKVSVVEAKGSQASFEGRFHPFWPVISVPELCANEEIVAPHTSVSQHFLYRLSHRRFIPISLRAVELAKANLQSSFRGAQSVSKIGIKVPKPSAGIALPLLIVILV
jgi:hypothetical protein